MPTNRQKFNFYAVTNGRETGIYTSWTHAGNAVLGFAKAKYKGFSTYSDAAAAMLSSLFRFNVFDEQNTYGRSDYEQSRGHQLGASDINSAEQELIEEDASLIKYSAVQKDSQTEFQDTTPTVCIDGSFIRNGTVRTAQAGYGLFWGDEHSKRFRSPESIIWKN